ncbi:MAG: hypothetical protein ACTHKJ_02610 [Candidatus Nitrosocosmicus sp.]
MNKYKDIRIIKEKSSSASTYDNNYTFVDNIYTSKTNDVSSANTKDKVNGAEQTLRITIDNKKKEKYKKKKVVDKGESKSKFKALKFSNPSQRNHSSVYE